MFILYLVDNDSDDDDDDDPKVIVKQILVTI